MYLKGPFWISGRGRSLNIKSSSPIPSFNSLLCTQTILIFSHNFHTEDYSGFSTNTLLGGADGKLLAYSSIRLSLLGTNETFIFLGKASYVTLPYLASGAGMSLKEAPVLDECISLISLECDISLALLVYKR